ncbi:MAG: sigma-54-dependent Fis family transcriptional regulator [Hydrogenobaculum sp.]|nr:MAG: sigma-54-dependent Fis family transcriptional regulator [Hydrogenobaculum sp.]PMP93000.1 MAG: sigma-54-dependent Fis family transcriptional regulator [Hydrogenobaculum sp.]
MNFNLFENISDGVIIVSKDKKIVYFNKSAKNFFPDIALNKSCYGLYNICENCPLEIAKEENRNINIYDVKLSNKRVCFSMNPIFMETEFYGVIEIFRDVSRVIHYMEDVHKQKEFTEKIFNSIVEGIIVVDKEGKVINLNDSAKKLLCNLDTKDAIGHHVKEILGIDLEQMPALDKRNDIYIQTYCGKLKASLMLSAFRDEGYIISFYILPEQNMFYGFSENEFHTKSPKLSKAIDIAKYVAEHNVNVLIEGETGTGKTLLAKYIHFLSPRRNKPFVKINCAAIPENLLESELFGYVKGAFTGAIKDKVGKVELANEGTLFLDEIGDMPLSIQAKILNLIQEKEIERLGDNKTLKVDVRIIAATNKDMRQLIKNRLFREDLYYRLNVVNITLPPLRDRKEDIPTLVRGFLEKFSEIHKKSVKSIRSEAIKLLLKYDYPGNVRELENIIEHAVIMTKSDYIDAPDLPEFLASNFDVFLENLTEKDLIVKTLKQTNGNKAEAAKILNMHRTTLWRKIKEYGIEI